MNNISKIFYILAEALILLAFAAFAYYNPDRLVEYTCPVMQKVYTTKLYVFAFVFLAGGYAAGYAICAFIKANMSKMVNAYQKRSENISIASESDKARIMALESKISTLETALKAALDNK